MKRWLTTALTATVLFGLTATASAQSGIGAYNRPFSPRPTISPYLNLNRGGTNPAINYYGIVRPQLQTTQSLQQFQQELQMQTDPAALGPLGQATAVPGQEMVSTTGHPVSFFNYSHYYPGVGGRGTLTGGASAASRNSIFPTVPGVSRR